MTQDDEVLMVILLPLTYTIVDLLKPIPFIPGWILPTLAAATGTILGVVWGLATGHEGPDLMVYGAVGFGFGAGATGMNQVKQQGEKRQEENKEKSDGTLHRS